jgi:hypothetical protein
VAELVRADAHEVGAELVEVDREMAGRDGRVDVHQHAPRAARGNDLVHWLHGADLVVGPLHVHERSVGFDGREKGIDIEATVRVDSGDGDTAVLFGRATHSAVFDRREHLVRSALCGTPRGHGDGFGGTAREHDLARPRAEQDADRVARLLDGHARAHALGVDASRVAAQLVECDEHRVARIRAHR